MILVGKLVVNAFGRLQAVFGGGFVVYFGQFGTQEVVVEQLDEVVLRELAAQLDLTTICGVFEFVFQEWVFLGEFNDVRLGYFENGRVFGNLGELAGKAEVINPT